MLVPEATVNEDYSLVFRQNDVRFAREFAIVEAIAEAHPVQERTHVPLDSCPFALDR